MKAWRVLVVAAGVLAGAVGCSNLLGLDKNYSVGHGGAAGAEAGPGTGGAAGGSSNAGDAGPDAAEGGPLKPYYQEVLSSFPALYLRLGESSGPVAKDEEGNHSGTYPDAGVTFGVPGAIANDPNTAVAFDGAHAISMPPGFDLAPDTSFTIEVWAKQTAYKGLGFGIDHDDYANGRDGWDLYFSSGTVSAERWNGGSTSFSNVHTDAGLTLGGYHYVVVTFDGTGTGTLCVYVDAVRMRCTQNAGAPISSTGITWAVGSQNCICTPNGFNGALDEFALYTHVLTPAQIAAHYHAGLGH